MSYELKILSFVIKIQILANITRFYSYNGPSNSSYLFFYFGGLSSGLAGVFNSFLSRRSLKDVSKTDGTAAQYLGKKRLLVGNFNVETVTFGFTLECFICFGLGGKMKILLLKRKRRLWLPFPVSSKRFEIWTTYSGHAQSCGGF